MSELAKRVEEARGHVVPEWTPAREREVRDRAERELGRAWRRRATGVALAALVACAVGLLLVWNHAVRRAPQAPPVAVVAPASPDLLHMEDGTVVTATTSGAQVEPIEVAPHSVAVRLASGGARFSVTPNPERTFRVVAKNVTVTVLGTVFTVDLEAGGVRVGVERGKVHVAWPSGDRVLAVGERMLVRDEPEPALSSPIPADATPPPDAAATPMARTGRNAVHSPSEPSWRALADEGAYARAFARMDAEGPSAVHDEPGDLLLAADVARLGGHPEKAVPPLERVVSAHADDSRAPLAAFTLGRTLLDQLGRPREAAQAFATARRLAPRGALAQDALAREVEGWSRAGEASVAHDRAAEYVKDYPNGRRIAAVKQLGSIDEPPSAP